MSTDDYLTSMEDTATNEAVLYLPFLSPVRTEKPAKIMHHHNCYEIIFLIESNHHLYVKNECYALLSRQLVLFSPLLVHSIVISSDSEYRRVILDFNLDFIEDLLQNCDCLDIMEIFNIESGEEFNIINLDIHDFNVMNSLFAQLQTIYKEHQDKNTRYSLANLKLFLCSFLVKIHEICKSNEHKKTSDTPDNLTKNVTDYLDEHFRENITLPTLSAKFHVSESYLSRKFSHATGMTIVEYLQYRRILEAQKMLANPNMPISEICYDNGFNNLQHFYRTFKKITGITPSKWRSIMGD